MPRPSATFDFIHDYTGTGADTQKTYPVQVPEWTINALLFVPALNVNSVVSMEMIEIEDVTAAKLIPDQDTDWKAVLTEGEASQIVASGVEDCWIDITEFIRACPPNCFVRFVMAQAQGADSTWIIVFRGK